jgi:hypothetical protein
MGDAPQRLIKEGVALGIDVTQHGVRQWHIGGRDRKGCGAAREVGIAE